MHELRKFENELRKDRLYAKITDRTDASKSDNLRQLFLFCDNRVTQSRFLSIIAHFP